jgi:hypothetical protein
MSAEPMHAGDGFPLRSKSPLMNVLEIHDEDGLQNLPKEGAMKASWLEIFISVIFIIFATALLFKEEYGFAVLLLFGLLVIIKLDELTDLTFNLKGGFKAKFEI